MGVLQSTIAYLREDLEPMKLGNPMAKKKRASKPDPTRMVTRALRMTEVYADWLDRYADKERVSLASLLDRALARDAEHTGFEAPPRRLS
jgi:hypothetical protein